VRMRERGSNGGIRKTRLGASTAKNLKRNGGGNGAAGKQGRPRAIVDEVVYRTQEGVMSGWCTERQCASQTWKRVAGKNNVCGLGVAVGRAVDMNGGEVTRRPERLAAVLAVLKGCAALSRERACRILNGENGKQMCSENKIHCSDNNKHMRM
jgi:hypothetical protein